ncbi:hypothetical protein [Aquirhabdus sp.]|uniref:hypothetical protein n=1 Tax=Aquirhabdus sp. TaxID=2824160 RepID=UPI00396CCE24
MKHLFQLTALSTALVVAGCGGGGGGGFYGPSTPPTTTTPTTPTTPAAVATNYHIVLSSNKPTMVATGDTAVVTVKLVDVNGGGVSAQNVTLSIPNTITNGVTINGASSLATDANGNASFTINLPATSNAAALIASGITLNATFTDETKKTTSQTTVINVVQALTPATSTAQYHLTMSSNKPTLVVTGDNAIVTVKAVDVNGGGVAGQNVMLSIPDTLTNGVTVNGPSTLTTDANGNAAFTVILPAASAANTAALIAKGVTINASLTDVNGVTSKQSTLLNVVATPITQPVANITFGNSALLQTSTDGTYYTESLSASVVGLDGKPIVNQPVVISISLLGFAKGTYVFNPNAKPTATRESGRYTSCPLNPPTPPSFVQIATTFVAPSVSTDGTVTYTTDSTGKFDFQVRFLRRFGTWQTVNISAVATASGATVKADLPYTLSVLKGDFDNAAGQPFDVSPYGAGPDVLQGAPAPYDSTNPAAFNAATYSARYNAYLQNFAITSKQSYPIAPDVNDPSYVADSKAFTTAFTAVQTEACSNQN